MLKPVLHNKHVLVAPLNWGLGHATKSIPVIKASIKHSFEAVIASDGVALELLKLKYIWHNFQ